MYFFLLMKKRKVFFGVSVPPKVARRIAGHMEAWSDWPLRPVRERNLHVTALFIGFRTDDDIAELVAGAQEACQMVEPFDILLDQTVFAPEEAKHAQSMIWFAGGASKEFLALRNALEASIGTLTTEKKQFRPHVTLARIRRTKWDELPEKPTLTPLRSVSFPVSSFTLFESTFRKGVGLVYEVIEEFPLGNVR